jgi:hypothetical protein
VEVVKYSITSGVLLMIKGGYRYKDSRVVLHYVGNMCRLSSTVCRHGAGASYRGWSVRVWADK